MAAGDPLQWEGVYAGEIQKVKLRRASRETDDRVKSSLVGLAFSGGGIRSATFGLGVLESLKELGLLARMDYLSTVSGGGFIGGWLSANCKRAADRNAAKWLDKGTDWDKSIAHLRRYSKYLSPEVGFFSADTWSMAAIWMRNTLLVQLTVIFAIAVVLLLPRPLFELFLAWPAVGLWRWATVVLFIVAVAGIAGNQRRVSSESDVPFLRAKNWVLGLVAGAVLLLLAWILGAAFDFDPFTNARVDCVAAFFIALVLVLAGFSLLPVGVKLVNKFWRGEGAPERINYTQSWVQAVVVIPMMVTGYLVAAVLWGQTVEEESALRTLDSFGKFFSEEWKFWPFPLYIALASLWLLSFCSIRASRKTLIVAFLAPFPAVLALYLLLCAIMLLLHGWAAGDPQRGQWLAFVWAPALVLYAFTLSIVVLIGMLGRQSVESVREWWSRLGAWLAIYGFAWMVVAVAAVYGPKWAAAILDADLWKSLSLTGGWLGTTLAGLLAGRSNTTGGTSSSAEARKSTVDTIKEVVAAVGPFVFITGLLISIATCLHLIILSNSVYSEEWSIGVLDWWHWKYMSAQPMGAVGVALAVAVAGAMILARRVDINEFSLNEFYRSRLSRCYLGATRFEPGERKPQNFTGFDENDDMALTDLVAGERPAGPLHIVNCALNLGGSSDLALHTRHGASFTLTPYDTGTSYGPLDRSGLRKPIGYRKTAEYGGTRGQPTLGQAISVSGAAASPNMGYHTSPVVAFLLTMFNARLGWWFPNPRGPSGSPSPRNSLRYLLTELFGVADDKSNFLMISDGGHFENLAAYELIRRKCRVVIISDGECDPDLQFEGLGTLIRMCEVDFGVKIDIDVGSIRRHSGSKWSSNRWAVGRIEYDPDDRQKDGVLIYLKASMTGDEDTAILQYQAGHSTFPHEPTGNQFYGEDQFESYRRLGYEVGTSAFTELRGKDALPPALGGAHAS